MEYHEQNNLNDDNRKDFKSNEECFKFRKAIVNMF